MPFEPATLDAVSDLWRSHARAYAPAMFGLVLCGDDTEDDEGLFRYIMSRAPLLDDMAGPYTSLTLIAWQVDERSREITTGTDLGYLHAAPSWRMHAQGVYSVAHALKVPLEHLPVVVLAARPQVSDKTLVVRLRRDPRAGTGQGAYGEPLKMLLSACRAAADEAPEKRLRLIEKRLRATTKDGAGVFARFSETGILAQIIEGLVKGLS